MKLSHQLSGALIIASVILCCGISHAQGTTEAQLVRQDVFHYSMNGRVRPLLFWFGRNDVGGGHITLAQKEGTKPGSWIEYVEVLFGSKPQRVPGKINRWGYGHEMALWNQDNSGKPPCLEGTVFEGFIRHSSEESLSAVKNSDSTEKTKKLFWYDGIQSRVSLQKAETAVWQFSQDTDFDFESIKPAIEAYQARRKNNPDKTKQVVNKNNVYSEPLGFLTATRHLMLSVSDAYLSGKTDWYKEGFETGYAYNAQIYRMRMTRISYQEKLPADFGSNLPVGIGVEALQGLAEAEFELNDAPPKNPHRFSILFPLRGACRAIPLRIRDRPRWWLEVELLLARYERIGGTIETVSFGDIDSIPRMNSPNCEGNIQN